MLIKCPECDLPISDHAVYCPHCGYPLQPNKLVKTYSGTKNKRRMRLPNGFGQITEIKGKNLRNPFRVMVPAGKDETGRPISKLLKPKAYFRTYNEAYAALVDYNKDPYDPNNLITVDELYNLWIEKYKEKITVSRLQTIKASWLYCGSIYQMYVRDVRPQHMKECIENGRKIKDGVEVASSVPITMKQNIKFVFNLLFDYAVECGIVDKNYARTFGVSEGAKESSKLHSSFSDNAMNILWANIKNHVVRAILIQCYMGWRPTEMLEIQTEKVLLDQNIIIGGKKTKKGIDRHVPIHPKVRPFVESIYAEAKEKGLKYLFETSENADICNYPKYRVKFESTLENLGIEPGHTPHDPRKHFVTTAKKYKLDEWAIKRIVGHAIQDLTEGTYTDRSDEWLYEEVCKIEPVVEIK
jgi:site-specific recombinase XerD